MIEGYSLEGRNIVVSGASSGIGRSTAILCNQLGATVILIGRNEERLQETKGQFVEPSNGIIFQGDLQQGEFFDSFEAFLVSKKIKVNGLVHAAGISPTIPLRILSPEKMDSAIETNIKSSLSLSRLLCKANICGEGMSIVFITSVMASVGASGKSLYGMTKGALVAASKSLAIEYAPKGIRFNTVSPGVVLTPMSLSSVYANDAAAMQAVANLHPLGLGQPEDVAYTAAFLLSRASRWITGSDIKIDGGYTAR